MHPILDLFYGLLVLLLLTVKGIVLALIPTALLPKKDIKGWKVLVTGSGSGLGRMLSVRLAQQGCHLILWDMNEEGNLRTQKMVKQFGVKCNCYTVDLSNRELIYEVADKVKEEVGDVDMLINNAGIVTGRKLLQCPDHLMIKTMEVNTMALFWTTKSFLPAMMKKNKGHLVTIASAAAFAGIPSLSDYCASKAGAVLFDDTIRAEMYKQGKSGVNVTTVCPYYINTGMFDGVTSKIPFLMPIMEPDYAVDRMMTAILINQDILYLPRMLYILHALMAMLPTSATLFSSSHMGFHDNMDDFKGRAKKD